MEIIYLYPKFDYVLLLSEGAIRVLHPLTPSFRANVADKTYQLSKQRERRDVLSWS